MTKGVWLLLQTPFVVSQNILTYEGPSLFVQNNSAIRDSGIAFVKPAKIHGFAAIDQCRYTAAVLFPKALNGQHYRTNDIRNSAR